MQPTISDDGRPQGQMIHCPTCKSGYNDFVGFHPTLRGAEILLRCNAGHRWSLRITPGLIANHGPFPKTCESLIDVQPQ